MQRGEIFRLTVSQLIDAFHPAAGLIAVAYNTAFCDTKVCLTKDQFRNGPPADNSPANWPNSIIPGLHYARNNGTNVISTPVGFSASPRSRSGAKRGGNENETAFAILWSPSCGLRCIKKCRNKGAECPSTSRRRINVKGADIAIHETLLRLPPRFANVLSGKLS